jgi:hypothetical protein
MQPVRVAESVPPVAAGRRANCLTELVEQHLAERERVAVGQLLNGHRPVGERQRQSVDLSVGAPVAGPGTMAGARPFKDALITEPPIWRCIASLTSCVSWLPFDTGL